MNQQDKIKALQLKIEHLEEKLSFLQQEVRSVKTDLEFFQKEDFIVENQEVKQVNEPMISSQSAGKIDIQTALEKEKPKENFQTNKNAQKKAEFDLENFIGGNLISKIGILLLLIGLAYFVNYAIEKNLIPPLLRILLAYVAGAILIVLSYRLRSKYKTYSALLFGGGTATFYLSTFIGYAYLEVLPYAFAFAVMILTSVFVIIQAVVHDEEIIGIVGLVGAYAVPLFLNTGSGKIEIYFTYVALINLCISVISFQKEWIRMNQSAFTLTWLFFLSWFTFDLKNSHFDIVFAFNCIFFAIFQVSLLAYFLKKSSPVPHTVLLLLVFNAALFYLFGVSYFNRLNFIFETLFLLCTKSLEKGNASALFSLGNALFYGVFCWYLYIFKQQGSRLMGLSMVFAFLFFSLGVYIFFPVEAVILIWLSEALALLYVAGKYKHRLMENMAYVLTFFSFWQLFSLLLKAYDPFNEPLPFLLNSITLTTMGVVIVLSIAIAIYSQFPSLWKSNRLEFTPETILTILISGLVYVQFFLEINAYFTHLYNLSVISSENQAWLEEKTSTNKYANLSYLYLGKVWLLIYSFTYLAFLDFIKFRPKKIFDRILIVSALVLFVFLCLRGIDNLYLLNQEYWISSLKKEMAKPEWYFYLRYVLYASVGLCILAMLPTLKNFVDQKNRLLKAYYILLHVTVIALLSFELSQWYVYFGFSKEEDYVNEVLNAWKTGFSLLWGIYAMAMIVYGIYRRSRYLRFFGITLLGITLLKLFVNDLTYNTNLSKTLAFLGLGILLLLIAFLYQKFKDVILADDEIK